MFVDIFHKNIFLNQHRALKIQIEMFVSYVVLICLAFLLNANSGSPQPPDRRIVEGRLSATNHSKSMVSIRMICMSKRAVEFGSNHVCGGTILSKRAILTAAHCLCNR